MGEETRVKRIQASSCLICVLSETALYVAGYKILGASLPNEETLMLTSPNSTLQGKQQMV